LERFVAGICDCQKKWTTDNIIADLVQNLKDQIGDNNVLRNYRYWQLVEIRLAMY
jgi:GMP synthase (glutamine-hydrolysing)